MVLHLEAGGRIVYKKVDQLNERTGTHNKWTGQHAALLVRTDEFIDAYRHMWTGLPESEHHRFQEEVPDESTLPPRTELHGLVALRERSATFARGTSFYDWDTNCFHFSGGRPCDGSMAHYQTGYNDNNMPEEAYAGLAFKEGETPDRRVRD